MHLAQNDNICSPLRLNLHCCRSLQSILHAALANRTVLCKGTKMVKPCPYFLPLQTDLGTVRREILGEKFPLPDTAVQYFHSEDLQGTTEWRRVGDWSQCLYKVCAFYTIDHLRQLQ